MVGIENALISGVDYHASKSEMFCLIQNIPQRGKTPFFTKEILNNDMIALEQKKLSKTN